jgi:hypothetical protein
MRSRNLFWVMLIGTGAYFIFSVSLWGQTGDSSSTLSAPSSSANSSSAQSGPKPWTATRESQDGSVNPTRTVESHVQSGSRTVDKQTIERLGDSGNYEPYQGVEKETVQVNGTTVRTTTRTFGLASGERTLVQETQEEKQSLAGGDGRVVRATSNPDGNGNLQVVQREVEETKKISANVTETKTTVMLSGIEGGLEPATKTEQRETRNGNTVETQKTTLHPDGEGNWQVGEVRRSVVKQDGGSGSREEVVSRPDADGKLEEVSRTVTKDTGVGPEKRETVESYSVDVPGAPRDGGLHLVQRTTTVQQNGGDGRQNTVQQVERVDAGDPSAGVRVSVVTTDAVRAGASGAQATRTVEMRDANDEMEVVRLDTAKSDNVKAVQVEIGEKQK